MIWKFLTDNALKLLGVMSLFTLIGAAVLGFKLWRANEALSDEKQRHETSKAQRDRYADALRFYVNDGQIRLARGRQALKEHESVSADLQRQATKIRMVRVVSSGNCPTPKEVMEASGL